MALDAPQCGRIAWESARVYTFTCVRVFLYYLLAGVLACLRVCVCLCASLAAAELQTRQGARARAGVCVPSCRPPSHTARGSLALSPSPSAPWRLGGERDGVRPASPCERLCLPSTFSFPSVLPLPINFLVCRPHFSFLFPPRYQGCGVCVWRRAGNGRREDERCGRSRLEVERGVCVQLLVCATSHSSRVHRTVSCLCLCASFVSWSVRVCVSARGRGRACGWGCLSGYACALRATRDVLSCVPQRRGGAHFTARPQLLLRPSPPPPPHPIATRASRTDWSSGFFHINTKCTREERESHTHASFTCAEQRDSEIERETA